MAAMHKSILPLILSSEFWGIPCLTQPSFPNCFVWSHFYVREMN